MDTPTRPTDADGAALAALTAERDALLARLATLGAQVRAGAIEQAAWQAERERLRAALGRWNSHLIGCLFDGEDGCDCGLWDADVLLGRVDDMDDGEGADAEGRDAARSIDDDLADIRREWGITTQDAQAALDGRPRDDEEESTR